MADRPLLVFAHYFGGSAQSWAPLLAALGGDIEAIAPDVAGFGGTSAPDGELTLELYADRFEALASGRPWIAVGHSMGGKIALSTAARRPPGLKAMILVAPSPQTPEPMTEEERQETIDAFGDRTEARKHIREIAHHTLTPEVFARCVEDEVNVDRRAWMWWMQTGTRRDISDQTAGLDLPTLVITGDDDKVMGLKTPFAVAAGLRHAEVRVIAGGGHLVPLEQPKAVADAMRGFLAGLSAQAVQP